jgi:hypothetical protein
VRDKSTAVGCTRLGFDLGLAAQAATAVFEEGMWRGVMMGLLHPTGFHGGPLPEFWNPIAGRLLTGVVMLVANIVSGLIVSSSTAGEIP